MTDTAIVQTKLGEATIVATSTTHVHFSASNGDRIPRNLTVRGIPYHVSAHLFLWSDGAWHLGKEDEPKEWKRGEHLYASRTDRYHGPKDLNASASARKVLTAEAERVVTEWAQTDEGQRLIRAGAARFGGYTLDRIDRSISDKRAELAELEQQRAAAIAELDAVTQ